MMIFNFVLVVSKNNSLLNCAEKVIFLLSCKFVSVQYPTDHNLEDVLQISGLIHTTRTRSCFLFRAGVFTGYWGEGTLDH